MIGCSFVVDREYFGDIGLLDPGMEVYGGENIELGMRVSGRSGRWGRRAGPPGLRPAAWRVHAGQQSSPRGSGAGSVPFQLGEAGPLPGAPTCGGPCERCPPPPHSTATPQGQEAAVPSCHLSQGLRLRAAGGYGRRSPRGPLPACPPSSRRCGDRPARCPGSGLPRRATQPCGQALVGWRFLDFLCFVAGVSLVFGFCLRTFIRRQDYLRHVFKNVCGLVCGSCTFRSLFALSSRRDRVVTVVNPAG